jgi:flavodoxin
MTFFLERGAQVYSASDERLQRPLKPILQPALEQKMPKHLLIVYHSKTGNTQALARAAHAGATDDLIEAVDVRLLRAHDAGPADLLWADALLLGTPENFGYMSGAMKDFLDRTFYEVEGRIASLPYAIFISAGNDGTGAVSAIQRIGNGYPFNQVQQPLIVRDGVDVADLERCKELGMTLAAGLDAGLY